ncbi:MAG: hypothetical protein QM831_03145 [Kofleriaceae bacterium]
MTKRWWLVLATVVFALSAGIAAFIGVGKAVAAPVSNCNRDCDDGSFALMIATVLAGLAAISLVVTIYAYVRSRPPRIPVARTYRG